MSKATKAALSGQIERIPQKERKDFLTRLTARTDQMNKLAQRFGFLSLALALILSLRMIEPKATLIFDGQQISSLRNLNALLFVANGILYILAATAYVHRLVGNAIVRETVALGDEPNVILAYSYGAGAYPHINDLVFERARADQEKASLSRRWLLRLWMPVVLVVMTGISLLPIAVNIVYLTTSFWSEMPSWPLLVLGWALVGGQLAAAFGYIIHAGQYGEPRASSTEQD